MRERRRSKEKPGTSTSAAFETEPSSVEAEVVPPGRNGPVVVEGLLIFEATEVAGAEASAGMNEKKNWNGSSREGAEAASAAAMAEAVAPDGGCTVVAEVSVAAVGRNSAENSRSAAVEGIFVRSTMD